MNRSWWGTVVKVGLALGVAVAVATPEAAAAASMPEHEASESRPPRAASGPIEKLARGVTNALSGLLEIPWGVQSHYNRRSTAPSVFLGAVTGVAKAALRTGVGVYETATFFLPFPPGYAPILDPPAYFDKTHRHDTPFSYY